MKPAFNKLSRRQFLLGTGGLALPLPLLPSLFPGNAEAQVVQESSKRFFVQTTTYHAVFASQFFGPLLNVAPSERIANYAGFEVRKAALKSAAQGNGTFISPILQTKKAPMSAKVLGLMNVINGLDMITFQGHNFGGVAGGSGSDPSIDQVMAASKKLFPGTQGAPAIVRHKVSLSKVGNNSGTQATTNTAQTNVKLFDLLFGTNVAANEQPLIVDAVRGHLAAVRSDSAISAECRNLMDAHVEMMFQAETNLRAQIGGNSGVARPTSDTGAITKEAGFVNNPARQAEVERLFNEIVVAAFASGLSRIYMWGPDDEYTFSPIARGPFHEAIAHQLGGRNASTQGTFNDAAQVQFEVGLVDMANRLDAVRTADGKTLLDKALITWGWEMGSAGIPGFHHGRGIPVVSIGNAGGFFNTGLSVDYRNLNSFSFSANDEEHWFSGLTYNQWMGMVLRSMGMLPSEYSTNNGAFGYPSVKKVSGDYPDAMWALAGTDLPFLRGTGAPPTF